MLDSFLLHWGFYHSFPAVWVFRSLGSKRAACCDCLWSWARLAILMFVKVQNNCLFEHLGMISHSWEGMRSRPLLPSL